MSEETVRLEEDLLGEKLVPNHVYYGIQTSRAQENFPITGYLLEKELIKGIAVVKKAAAVANMEVGRRNLDIGHAIVSAADEIIAGELHDQFLVGPAQGGAGTATKMNAK